MPKADGGVVKLVRMKGFPPKNSVADFWLLDKPWWQDNEVGLLTFFVEYKLQYDTTVVNQLVMDIISAARFAHYMGLRSITIWGCLITGAGYMFFSARAVRVYSARPYVYLLINWVGWP